MHHSWSGHQILMSWSWLVPCVATNSCVEYMPKNKAWAYISVTSITDNLGHNVSDGLLRIHAFSGCDSTSRFTGCGKRTVLKLLMENNELCQALTSLGENFDMDANTLKQAEKAICHLYNSVQCSNTKEVHRDKWNRQTTEITKLPPCHDSSILHIR